MAAPAPSGARHVTCPGQARQWPICSENARAGHLLRSNPQTWLLRTALRSSGTDEREANRQQPSEQSGLVAAPLGALVRLPVPQLQIHWISVCRVHGSTVCRSACARATASHTVRCGLQGNQLVLTYDSSTSTRRG